MKDNKLRRQGRPAKVWTPEKRRLLKKLYPKNKNPHIADELGVSVSAIRQKASAMGLKKKGYNWSDRDKQWLRQNYMAKSIPELIDKLGRTHWAIINQWRELTGLRPE